MQQEKNNSKGGNPISLKYAIANSLYVNIYMPS